MDSYHGYLTPPKKPNIKEILEDIDDPEVYPRKPMHPLAKSLPEIKEARFKAAFAFYDNMEILKNDDKIRDELAEKRLEEIKRYSDRVEEIGHTLIELIRQCQEYREEVAAEEAERKKRLAKYQIKSDDDGVDDQKEDGKDDGKKVDEGIENDHKVDNEKDDHTENIVNKVDSEDYVVDDDNLQIETDNDKDNGEQDVGDDS